MSKLDQLRPLITQGLAPGVSAAYLHDGVSEMLVLGDAQTVPERQPLHAGALYDVASLTKVLGTTTVFLQAWAAGRLTPDTPLRTFLPQFPHATTFRQALTHTSGLEGYIPHRDDLPAAELKQALLTQLTVTAECDRQVVYRDVNLLLVGWALEKIDLAPIQLLIRQRVLSPLGLTSATFNPVARRCVPTTYDAATQTLRQGLVHDPKSAILGCHSGAAGLFASLGDLMRFSTFAFGQQTNDAWPATFDQLLQDQTVNGLGRSLGWDLRRDGQDRLWLYHTGYTGTFWLIQPTIKQALIVLTNRVHPVVNPAFLPWRDEFIAEFLRTVA
ncbi:serine hydrolase domain-containing protein [Lacticaseibacillus daqingensis]|uniref:serine hydrolase domain-containing protein n=1 Tax=Lacticaseibacillus daqingensis TaxID=2486014 RepID=UPI000F7BAAD8|nr:serine hydrolase domain-containing protein [Lacticaseibacillus daqingensis]